MPDFEKRLTGGHPNSLGNTEEVVAEVLEDHSLFDELFNCYFSKDEVVRLRTSSAVKRVCKAEKQLVLDYLDRLLNEISKIDQASTQWTLSHLFGELEKDMTPKQHAVALKIMKNNLEHHEDWIVLNTTMDVLTKWARKDATLKTWIIPVLKRHSNDPRKSVSRRSAKILSILEK